MQTVNKSKGDIPKRVQKWKLQKESEKVIDGGKKLRKKREVEMGRERKNIIA